MGEIEQLVRRAKKRDPDAFTELMQLHEKDMYRTASAILPQDADIADAIQETILTVWEKIDTLQKNRYFKTWMIRILINKCKDILRSGRRMICVEELPEQAAKDTVEAEANLEWKEALQGLDEKYRLIVVLFYAEDCGQQKSENYCSFPTVRCAQGSPEGGSSWRDIMRRQRKEAEENETDE